MKADLHIHSIHSDGNLFPNEIVDEAINRNLDIISITDHDSIDAIEDAKKYASNTKLTIIPGIEFSCIYNDEEIHILGYNFNYNNKSLKILLNNIHLSRQKRAKKILKKLNNFNIKIDYKDLLNISKNKFISRFHIAKILVEKEYVNNTDEAFNQYIGIGKPCYVDRYRLTVEEAINIIESLNGISILAHPGLLSSDKYIYKCIDLGIDGIEAIHSKHDNDDIKKFINIAMDNNIKYTGGSDCHGVVINEDLLLGNYTCNINNLDFFNK